MTERLDGHSIDLLQTAIHASHASGETFTMFRRRIEQPLRANGWEYQDWKEQLRSIFLNGLFALYKHGQWQRIQRAKESAPYLRYVAVMDSRTRREHAAWDGIVLPVDHSWWCTHYPPNGWRCRCGVIQQSESNLERRGLSVSIDAPPVNMISRENPRTGEIVDVPEGIDPGFGHNVGMTGEPVVGWTRDAELLDEAVWMAHMYDR